jgi:hypothetical protein
VRPVPHGRVAMVPLDDPASPRVHTWSVRADLRRSRQLLRIFAGRGRVTTYQAHLLARKFSGAQRGAADWAAEPSRLRSHTHGHHVVRLRRLDRRTWACVREALKVYYAA